MSIGCARNPTKETKSHQAMWRARASTGLPPCHDLIAGGGEFVRPGELWENDHACKTSGNNRVGCERRNRNGPSRTVTLQQQRADTSPAALPARVHRLWRSDAAKELP